MFILKVDRYPTGSCRGLHNAFLLRGQLQRLLRVSRNQWLSVYVLYIARICPPSSFLFYLHFWRAHSPFILIVLKKFDELYISHFNRDKSVFPFARILLLIAPDVDNGNLSKSLLLQLRENSISSSRTTDGTNFSKNSVGTAHEEGRTICPSLNQLSRHNGFFRGWLRAWKWRNHRD